MKSYYSIHLTRSAESNVQVKDMSQSDNQSIWSIPQNPKVDGDRIKVKQKEKVVSTNKVPYPQYKGSVSKEDSEGFVLPYSQRKRIARKKTHVIKGTGSNGRVKGAPPPIRDFFVYRADTNTTEDDIKWLLDESEIKCVSVLRVSKPGSLFHSFKVSVLVTEQDKVMSAEVWPVGIQVRRFYQRITRPRQEDNDSIVGEEF